MVARQHRGPTLGLVGDLVLHEVPERTFDHGDRRATRDVKKLAVFVDPYSITEELTCINVNVVEEEESIRYLYTHTQKTSCRIKVEYLNIAGGV